MSKNMLSKKTEADIDKYLKTLDWGYVWDTWYTTWDWDEIEEVVEIGESWFVATTITKKELMEKWIVF